MYSWYYSTARFFHELKSTFDGQPPPLYDQLELSVSTWIITSSTLQFSSVGLLATNMPSTWSVVGAFLFTTFKGTVRQQPNLLPRAGQVKMIY